MNKGSIKAVKVIFHLHLKISLANFGCSIYTGAVIIHRHMRDEKEKWKMKKKLERCVSLAMTVGLFAMSLSACGGEYGPRQRAKD